LTGLILISSALIAAFTAAKFWENHSAVQLMGLVAAPPASLASSDPAHVFIQPVAFTFRNAAADFALGLLSGMFGEIQLLIHSHLC
jgi:hypothetical protein